LQALKLLLCGTAIKKNVVPPPCQFLKESLKLLSDASFFSLNSWLFNIPLLKKVTSVTSVLFQISFSVSLFHFLTSFYAVRPSLLFSSLLLFICVIVAPSNKNQFACPHINKKPSVFKGFLPGTWQINQMALRNRI